jgi:hypothetical protein
VSFRFDFYNKLLSYSPEILDEAAGIGRNLKIPKKWQGKIGVSGSNSSAPPTLRRKVSDAVKKASAEYEPLLKTGDEIRRIVKSVYGDNYDAVIVNSAEAGLNLVYDVLFAPSLIGRGEPPRSFVILPYERHIEHHGSYGRPFPNIYKDVFADRGATSGEFGLLGRRVQNVDVGFVKLAGARYEIHGIKSYISPLLLGVDATNSVKAFQNMAQNHISNLAGFISLGYDTPGMGYGEQDEYGAPLLQKNLGGLAEDFKVPYIADNAWGTPFLGTDPRKIGANVIIYSMDKVAGGASAGLIVGREDVLINIRRAMGVHGERFGTVSAHGKGSHVAFDPGKEALSGTLAALRLLRDEPESYINAVESVWEIALEEFNRFKGRLKPGIVLSKTVNMGGAEINYQDTWKSAEFGIPIFTHEDRIAKTNLLNNAIAKMGVVPNLSDDANIIITPGAGTMDSDGAVIEDRLRFAIRAVFAALELLQRWGEKVYTE